MGALLFRLPQLELRPLHADEAVHAVKLGELLETGAYVYNPHEYHGPTLYYFTLPVLRTFGATRLADISSEKLLLVVPIVCGSLLVLALLLVVDGLGWRAVVISAVLTAISPAMVYYSRYYIQEMLLVLFAFLMIGCGWHYVRLDAHAKLRLRTPWAIAVGAIAGLMYATKETSVILWACMVASLLLSLRKHNVPIRTAMWLHARFGLLLGATALFVAALFLSNFFRNPAALADAARGVGEYAMRAFTGDSSTHGTQAHRHPWYFYFVRLGFFRENPALLWTEGLILLLGFIGAASALLPKSTASPLLRFMAWYTILLTVVYSVIPYKTPWNALPFLHGWIILAGAGLIATDDKLPTHALRHGLALLFAGACAQLAWQAHRTNFVFPADTRNPYVYAGTSPDLLNLVRQVERAAAASPAKHETMVHIAAPEGDYWPLPWYLRRFKNVGYWNELPQTLDAPIVICSADWSEELADRLKGDHMKSFFGLRSGVLMNLCIRRDLWDALLARGITAEGKEAQ